MKTTRYFDTAARKNHPESHQYIEYVKKSLTEPHATEVQHDGRKRHYIYIPEADKYMRVVVERDGETVHNAMFDRNYTRRAKRKDSK